jgi:hypothetical protein
MHSHHWESAEGTIANAHSQPMEMPGKHGVRNVTVYDMDVRTPDGNVMEANVASEEHRLLRPGMVVRLEINSRTAEIRLHPKHENLVIRRDGPIPSRASERFAPPPGPGGPGAPGIDLGQLFGGNFPAAARVFVTTSAGADFPADGQAHPADAGAASELLRTVMSGDPAAKAAAKEQLRQLAQTQVYEPGAQFGQQPGSGQPGAAVNTGHAGPADRLAALQEMADRGQLSQAEFDAKRQQILDGI